MMLKRSVIRRMPHVAQDSDDVFGFIFNVINLVNGIIGLITNLIDFVEEIFGGGSNA